MAYKQQTFLSQSSRGAEQSKVEALADSVSGEDPLPGSPMAVLAWQKERETLWSLFNWGTDPICEGSTILA